MADPTAQERLDLAKGIVQMFLFERVAYLLLSFITAAIVVWVGFEVASKPGTNLSALGILFGSGGVVAFNIGRLLTMFNKVFKAVLGI